MTAYRDALQNGWAEFLGRYDWQWFCTFTFRAPTHPEAADKLYRVWISKLNRDLVGPRWTRRPELAVFWVRGLERQRRDVIHYHALLGCALKNLEHCLSRTYWADQWNRMAGFARLECIRSARDVAAYVSKYTVKGGEIDFSANLAAVRALNEEIALLELKREFESESEVDGPTEG